MAIHIRALILRSEWREVLEQFVDARVEILDVLVRVVGECVTRGSSPDQLLGFCIKKIDNHRAHLVCIGRGRCLAKTSATKTSPAPASPKPVVKGV
jgi:hypothetical protein